MKHILKERMLKSKSAMAKDELTYNNYRTPVPTAFEDVFTHFYFAENKSDSTVNKTLLPSYQTILVFSFGTAVSFITKQNTEVEIGKCLVVGPIKKGSGLFIAAKC
jgi:hypothetical protein